jgi:hypothetical protein
MRHANREITFKQQHASILLDVFHNGHEATALNATFGYMMYPKELGPKRVRRIVPVKPNPSCWAKCFDHLTFRCDTVRLV